jgi:hypothetical protein
VKATLQVEEVAPKLAKVKVKADVKRDPYAGMTRKKRRRLMFAKEAAATKAENDAKGVKTLDHGALSGAAACLLWGPSSQLPTPRSCRDT